MTFRFSLIAAFALTLLSISCEKKSKPTTVPVAAPPPPVFLTERGIRVTLVDKVTNQPLPDERITIYVNDKKTNDFTNPLGYYDITLPKEGLRRVTVHSRALNYVPTIRVWESVNEELELPLEFTLAVEPGTEIGGKVQDEAGNPIENARIWIQIHNSASNTNERPDYFHNNGFKTNAEGKWVCTMAPAEIQALFCSISHPEHGGISVTPDLAQLRTKSAVFILSKGRTPPRPTSGPFILQ